MLAPSGTAFLIPGTLVTLPAEDGAEGAPLVNQLLGRFVMQRPDKLDALAKKPRRTKVLTLTRTLTRTLTLALTLTKVAAEDLLTLTP